MNVTVHLSGPFFRDSTGPVVQSVHDAIEEIVLLGEREAKLMAQPRPSGLFHSRSYAASHGYVQTGFYNRSINGRMVGTLHGELTDSNVVYGPWLEGVSSRNQATRFKGYAIFRRTAEKLQTRALGVLVKHVRRAVDRLT